MWPCSKRTNTRPASSGTACLVFQCLLEWWARTDAPKLHVCMEAAGGDAEALAIFLIANGFTVSIVNSHRKGFGEVVRACSKTGKLKPSRSSGSAWR